MSNHQYRDTDEASDARFDTPYTADGADPGDQHEDADALSDGPPPLRPDLQRNPVSDYFGIGAPAQPARNLPLPTTMQGLVWLDGGGKRIDNLADPYWVMHASNIELRTVLAHLMEAATIARQAMRDRSMVVDL